jgi:hypothetical protein
MASVNETLDHYRRLLKDHAAGTLKLESENFDTGLPTKPGTYSLADQAYARLLDELDGKSIPEELRSEILAFYADLNAPFSTKRSPKDWQKVLKELDALKASGHIPHRPETAPSTAR